MKGKNEMLSQLEEGQKMLQDEMPGVMSKFKDFHDQVFKDGKLSVKEKRMIGLGMALALKCEYCIANHLKALKEMGAGLDEILEVCSVGMLMHGGPGVAYSTVVIKLWHEI